MQSRISKRFSQTSFLIALLLHVLFLLGFSTILLIQTTPDKKIPDDQSIPAYVYHGSMQPETAAASNAGSTQAEALRPDKQTENTAEIEAQPQPQHTPQAIYTQPHLEKVSAAKMFGYQPSIFESSRQILRQNQIQRALNRGNDPEPILLVGDMNVEASPLVRMMARALSANFQYPKYEGSLGIHGRVLVQLTFNPEGHFSDAEIVQSSDNENLDAAALYAVNKAPRVPGARRFLSKPKSYIVGFIFN
jgi:TonB family protein